MTPNYPVTAPVMVTFQNVTPGTGAVDAQTLDNAKATAPLAFATHNSATTGGDYAQLASTYSHPVFGTVSKAVAAISTSININQVAIYVLAVGTDGGVMTASPGLKEGLQSFLTDINVATDSVVVGDGYRKPVDVTMTVVVAKNADASVVKVGVDSALSNFFALSNWQMGQAFYVSQLSGVIGAVDGVKYVDIFTPADNILPTGLLYGNEGSTQKIGVAVNELIVLGNTNIQYYYASS
jgi:hypothetical protein